MSQTAGHPGEGRPPDVSPPGPGPEHSFLAARSIKRRLLEELASAGAGGSARAEDLLRHWPTDPAGDPDVASLLFQDYRQRSLRGEAPSIEEYERRFPEQADSLAGLFRRQDFLHSVGAASDPTPPLALPPVGAEAFGFHLRHQLGEGAFARVFLAEQAELAGRPVVLKISDTSSDEPQTLAQLQHTHIVPIYSVHEDRAAGLRAVCMPYFGGACLSRVLQAVQDRTDRPARGAQIVEALAQVGGPQLRTPERGPGLPHDGPLALLKGLDFFRASVWVVARLAEALAHAHDRGIFHRDIKPSNILLGADSTPMLLDFNLASSPGHGRASAEGPLGGTIAYMAPEHLRALSGRSPQLARQVDHRSDLYALGMVLFEVVTGHNPFDQKASYSPLPILVEAMAVERSRAVPSLKHFRPDAPWGLESIVRKCLQPEPEKRYQKAEHLAEDLRRLLDDRPLRHAPELSRAEQVRKWLRRHPRLAASGAVTAAVAALLLAGGSVLLTARTQLAAAQARAHGAEGAAARQRMHEFEQGTLRALCLVNTHSEFQEHARQGRAVCEQTLSLYGILEDPDWQGQPAWRRLAPAEQRRLAEDARELLLLLAVVRARLAGKGDGPSLLKGTVPFSGRLAPGDGATLREALALLDRAETVPGLGPSAAVWQARADCLRQLGDGAGARAAEGKARSIPPASARDHYLLATAYVQHGPPKRGLSPSPQGDSPLFGGAGRHALAVRELERALRLDPRHYWSWMQKGLCHLEAGEHHRALADFGVCVGLWPEFAWGYFNRGFALDQSGQKAAAVADYTAALERDPGLTAAYQNRGLANLELRRHADALADFERLVELGRRGPEKGTVPLGRGTVPFSGPVVQALRGQALEGLGRGREADAAFASALAGLGAEPEAVRNRILCVYGFAVCARLPDEAERAFVRVPARDPRFPEALYGRGLLAAQQKQTEQAVRYFSQALALRPGFGEPRRFRAVLLARLGRLEEAVKDINVALTAEPRAGPILYAAACVTALAAGRTPTPAAAQPLADQAVDFLRRALEQGYGRHAAEDPDLAAVRDHPAFGRLLASPQETGGGL